MITFLIYFLMGAFSFAILSRIMRIFSLVKLIKETNAAVIFLLERTLKRLQDDDAEVRQLELYKEMWIKVMKASYPAAFNSTYMFPFANWNEAVNWSKEHYKCKI